MSAGIAEELTAERAEGIAQAEGSFIANMLKAGKLAFSEIAQYAGVPLSRVRIIADSLGISE